MWNPEHTLNPDGSFDFRCEFIAYLFIYLHAYLI
jgi:hypothetical protein